VDQTDESWGHQGHTTEHLKDTYSGQLTLRWAAVFTLVTCSTKSYDVIMLKLLVVHFTAVDHDLDNEDQLGTSDMTEILADPSSH